MVKVGAKLPKLSQK